jgi:hypothetical protein
MLLGTGPPARVAAFGAPDDQSSGDTAPAMVSSSLGPCLLPMSMPTRQELLWRFGKSEDPEVEARRQHILDVLLEASPQTQQRLFDEGRLAEARAVLRRLLERRQLVPSKDDDARIEACTDLATLRRWHDRAVTAVSVSDALG